MALFRLSAMLALPFGSSSVTAFPNRHQIAIGSPGPSLESLTAMTTPQLGFVGVQQPLQTPLILRSTFASS